MICPSFRTSLLAACAALSLGFATSLRAAPKSESLLPDTTKGYVSVADLGVLRDSFNRSQWGQLAHDPALQPFVEDFRHQLQQKGVRQLDDLGLNWQDLEGVPGGEVSVAMVRPQPGRMAVVVIVDVTGHNEQATVLLDKIGVTLVNRGRLRIPRDDRDAIIVFNLPDQDGKRQSRQAAFFLKDDLLVAADDVATLRQILAATTTERTDSLAQYKPFREIMDRCTKSADLGTPEAPQIRWFVEPFGYATMIRETSLKPRRPGIDLLTALKNQGFTAVQGIGGYLNFAADNCELVHRTMIYAPPLAGHEKSKDKYELAARMLRFPTCSQLEPQTWVPAHVATYNTFNLDIQNAFASVGPLVDEVMAEKGVFHDVLDSLKNDPQGPRVDIEKDLIGNLGSRVTVVTDYQLPIGPRSERLLVAIETTNEEKVAETIAKTMKGDAARREFEGHVIWEIVDEESSTPDVKIEVSGGETHADKEEGTEKKKDRPLMQNAAVTVAYGHLFVASNFGFLETILRQQGKPDGLASCPDYQLVATQMKNLGEADVSFRLFSRTDEEYRPTYELIRTGQMPQSETVLAQVLNALLGDGKEGVLRKQKIDGGKLPAFQTMSHYFGPAGSFVSSETNGWFIVGFTLDKAQVSEALARKSAAPLKETAINTAETSDAPATVKESPVKEIPAKETPAADPAPSAATGPAIVTGEKPAKTAKK